MQVLHHIFPISVYAHLIAAAVALACVRTCGLRTAIRAAAVVRVATRLMLIFGRSLLDMQLLEVRAP